MAFLAFDLLAGVEAVRIDRGPPFSALLTLWLSTIAAVGLASRPITALNAALEQSNLKLQAEITERERVQDQLLQVLSLAEILGQFVDAIGLTHYALYLFDYGAPVGLRLAMAHPERVTAIVTQNGNAYVEGFGSTWEPWRAYWRDPTEANRAKCRAALTDDAIRHQHVDGAPAGQVAPDGYTLDQFYMHRPDADEIQLDLILSYRTNVALYPDFQAYFRAHRPRLLAVWGRNDAHFIPAGAEAFKRDLPEAEVHLLDTGHFALETHSADIAAHIHRFLEP